MDSCKDFNKKSLAWYRNLPKIKESDIAWIDFSEGYVTRIGICYKNKTLAREIKPKIKKFLKQDGYSFEKRR